MKSLKIYRYHGDGHALGSEGVCISYTKQQARTIFKAACVDNHLKFNDDDDAITLQGKAPEPPFLAHFWDGEY